MVSTVFATKIGMTQAWTTAGKRVAVTRCKVAPNLVVGTQQPEVTNSDMSAKMILEIGFGKKKLKNMAKPLRSRLEKGGFSLGAAQMRGLDVTGLESVPAVGQMIKVEDVLSVGDIVKVQGVTKGRGFAGAIKRHGFHGGPATHGQSDRARAVGSIGNRTTPGRVFKGKRMPGHYGTDTQTVSGLVVLHIDAANQEIWLSGPIPGFSTSAVRISKTGLTKNLELDVQASGIKVAPVAEPVTEVAETVETTVETPVEGAVA